MKRIEFSFLERSYTEIAAEIDTAVQRVLRSGQYLMGSECASFEDLFKQYLVGQEEGYVVGVTSGTDALRLSLLAAGVVPGDEVITIATTAIPTVIAVCSVGAIPVFCEVDKDTWLLDHNHLEKLITKKTKAIIPVHLYGFCSEMDKICEISKKYNIAVIEDVAHATGSFYKGRRAGTLADYGAFSFYPTKNIGAFGNGGAVFVRTKETYDRLTMLRNCGQVDRYHTDLSIGIHSWLDEIQAAILKVKLQYLDAWNDTKAALAKKYQQSIGLQHQVAYSGVIPAYYLFVVKTTRRAELAQYLKDHGIETLIHYPIALYNQKAFLKYKQDTLAVSEELSNQVLSLPFHQNITDSEVQYLFDIIKQFK
jgi:dTDP-4-amino-4,6-dideoxygalactose transaminase